MVKYLKQDALQEVDRFGDSLEGVSDSTKVALEGFFNLSDGVSKSLSEMHITSSRVTQEMATDLVGKYEGMNKQIVEGLNTRHIQEMDSMKNFFLNSSVLTGEEEAKILEKKQQTHDKEIELEEYKKKRITEILQLAADENRALTEREYEVINNINQQAQDQAVKVLSASEMEQKIIMVRLKETASIVSAQQAAEVVKNSAMQRDKSVKEVNAQYDETVAQIIRMRDETGVISAEQADKLIAEAKKQRDESVKYAENMHKDIVSEAKKQAGEHAQTVDWETGEILSKWAVFKNKMKQTFEETNKAISDKWNQMKTDTANKTIEILTATKSKFDEIKTAITKPIEDARDKVKNVIDSITGFFSNMKLKIPEISLPKLPKFNLTGSFSLSPPSVPKIDVSWNAQGGIFNKPTIFGTANAGLQGVGEAGAEAILPLNRKTFAGIGKGIAEYLNFSGQQIQTENYYFNFKVDKMVGDEADVKSFSNQIANTLKRERGMRR
ncbi:hypothetical protein [Psychrobacillus sp. L3]|uniref:hypothetical protein n=1 Tax=Psychrobacillus sp. L3 TaxID=3236891 RepID=UPI0036F2A886